MIFATGNGNEWSEFLFRNNEVYMKDKRIAVKLATCIKLIIFENPLVLSLKKN